MLISLSLLILLSFINSISSQQANGTSEERPFLEIATAILQNKNTFFDGLNFLSTFAYWHGTGWNDDIFSNFTMKQGLISQNWQINYDPSMIWSFAFHFYDSNYTDQNSIIIRIQSQLTATQVQINQSNATIVLPNTKAIILDYPDCTDSTKYQCSPDLYVYIVDRTTKKPPVEFDVSNLKAYTTQFRLVSSTCNFEFTTSFFEDTYYISQKDRLILVGGAIVFLIASLLSRYTRKPNKLKVSCGSLRLLMFFSFYIICYLLTWYSTINMASDVLYYFIPLAIVVIVDFAKHAVELCRNDKACCCCVFFGPLIAFILIIFPQAGVYVGDLVSCLFLLPQIFMKYKQRFERRKHITWFEIGNWICITLWVVYLDFYPNNVFLSSPKPTLVYIHSSAIFVQLSVLSYLQYGVPKKKLFKYTFAVTNEKDAESLLSDQCAICLNEFSEDEKLYRTPCGHLFHSDCLKEWGDKKLECPCCRNKIPGFVYPIE